MKKFIVHKLFITGNLAGLTVTDTYYGKAKFTVGNEYGSCGTGARFVVVKIEEQ